MKQLLQDIGKEIRGLKLAHEAQNLVLEAIITAIADISIGGGAVTPTSPNIYLLDDDGKFLLDDSGKRIYILPETETETPTGVTGNYHFVPVNLGAGTHALMPATVGVYYKVTFVFLSSTAGDTTWALKDGTTFQTGYTAGDIGFGAVIPLPENLFTTTTGNALNLVVTGGGTIQGHIVVYSYGD